MTLWKLELLRLVRTRRVVALVFVWLLFGLGGPLLAVYSGDLVSRFAGEGMVIELPDPVPADGITQFMANGIQIGLLVAVVVAAAALNFDATPEIGVFFRTRVARLRDLVLPKYAVAAGASIAAFALGFLAAWYESWALIGPLPFPEMLAGLGYGALYLAFAVAVVALAASLTRSVLTTVFGALALLMLLPALGIIGPLRPWLPSELPGAVDGVAHGIAPGEYLRAAAITVVSTVAALAIALTRFARREL